jgi:hypothetical protein
MGGQSDGLSALLLGFLAFLGGCERTGLSGIRMTAHPFVVPTME